MLIGMCMHQFILATPPVKAADATVGRYQLHTNPKTGVIYRLDTATGTTAEILEVQNSAATPGYWVKNPESKPTATQK